MKALYDPNVLAFALKGLETRVSWETLRQRAQQLESRYDLPFQRYVSRLRSMNTVTPQELLIGP
jgi:hypothetical protein